MTKTTPYHKPPDLSNLRVFGSRVCVKRPGPRRCKLDQSDYSGIFLGYTATDKNIIYLDTESGVVKTSHHATFDESWYLQPKRPPAAQLLYDLGLELESRQKLQLQRQQALRVPHHGLQVHHQHPVSKSGTPHRNQGHFHFRFKNLTATFAQQLQLKLTASHAHHQRHQPTSKPLQTLSRIT